MTMHISVFGGSSPKTGETPYEEAYQLGYSLALAGYVVLNGGYIGTMEAVSKGAVEAGGYVIGVTCDEIEEWRPVKPNPYILEERRYPTIRQRLFHLIESCNAAIALPGGIGTLAEVSEMWSHLQTKAISPRPLILVGSGWKSMLETFFNEFKPYISVEYRSLLTFVPTVDKVLEKLPK